MMEIRTMTPVAIKTGGRLRGFNCTSRKKQKNQSNTRLLWFGKASGQARKQNQTYGRWLRILVTLIIVIAVMAMMGDVMNGPVSSKVSRLRRIDDARVYFQFIETVD